MILQIRSRSSRGEQEEGLEGKCAGVAKEGGFFGDLRGNYERRGSGGSGREGVRKR